ncbi:aerotolerance-like protein [Bacteroidia bacterium]|nr:aerotolerance-like protein [Bacteroidia bacterium]
MKRIQNIFTLLFLMAATVLSAAPAVTFKASAPASVVVGEQFQLVYTVNADANTSDLRLQEEVTGFDVLSGPNRSFNQSIGFYNGQTVTETSVKFTFILMAKSEGTFTLPAATIRANNANYTSNSLSVKVLAPDKAAAAQENNAATGVSDKDIFMHVSVSKRSVYEQEGFLVTFKLYTKNPSVGFRNAKYPDFVGFLAQEIELPAEKQFVQEAYNGSNYFSVVLKQTVLYPQRTGNLSIESGKFDVTMRVRMQQRVQNIFNDFFETYQNVNKELATPSIPIEVKPLPSGKPASYANAVGDFSMKGSLSPLSVKANEAVTLKLDIAGTGNLRVVKNPEVSFPNDFEVYDPKVESNTRTTAGGVSGNKTIEYVAIPRYAGDFEIPAIHFSYFDTKSGAYKTLSAGPYSLHVEKGEGGESGGPVMSNFSNRENVRNIGQDVRYLKVKGIRFISKSDMFLGSPLFYLCYLLPALFFIAFFIIYRKQVKENADIARVRTRKANKTAVKRLKNAGKLMRESRKEEFYDETLRAVWGYLSDKLNIPVASLTKDNVEAELNKYGVGEPLINRFMDILNTCEFARYAPSQAPDALDKLYDSAINAIGEMENTIKG